MYAVSRPDDEAEPQSAGAPRRQGRNLRVAIGTGILLAGVLIGTLFSSLPAYSALVASAVVIAQMEFYGVLAKFGLQPARSLGVVAGLVIVLGTAWRGPAAMGFGLTAAVLATLAWYLLDPERERVSENAAITLFGIAYIPLLAAHVVAMAKLPHGPAVTSAFFGAVVFYDIGAYAAGSLFGRHRIAPAISPSKTWEGAAGATGLVALLGASIGPLFPGLDLLTSLGLAGIVVVCAPLGDLAESLIKRDLGVKDMGGLLPGHGGMLDRIDALLLTAPFGYWFLAVAR